MKKRYTMGVKAALHGLLVLALILGVLTGGVLGVAAALGIYGGGSYAETGLFDWAMIQEQNQISRTGSLREDMRVYAELSDRRKRGEALANEEWTTLEEIEQAYSQTNLRLMLGERDMTTGEKTVLYTLGGVWDDQTTLWTEVGEDIGRVYLIGANLTGEADDWITQTQDWYRRLEHTALPLGLVTGLCVVTVLVCMVLLLLAAGHRPDADGIFLRAFDRLPWIVMTGLLTTAGVMLWAISLWMIFSMMSSELAQMVSIFITFWMDGVLTFLLVWAWLLTTVTRCKAGMFWRTTLVGYIWQGLRTGASRTAQVVQEHRAAAQEIEEPKKRGVRALLPGGRQKETPEDGEESESLTDRVVRSWQNSGAAGAAERAGTAIGGFFRRLGGGLRHFWGLLGEFFGGLGFLWQGALCVLAVLVLFLMLAISCIEGGGDAIPFFLLFEVILFFGALWVLGQLARLVGGADRLAGGDLDYKIPLEGMRGALRTHAERLNAISDGMAVAVEHRLRSERLKTELLTNVSHDIKTPLTSIINYVDLLRKTDLQPAEAVEYAAVLERQSHKLKKLLDDLLEASKASTGNIAVELQPTDAGELLRQAAGEYNERLKGAGLTSVLRLGVSDCTIVADGRLLWRVFDNLLSNVVKYAMPGTRVYMDVTGGGGGQTVISFKNVSRDELTIDTEELMERFVRGDASRATEGSGLGLSIARSLTECMGGTFELSVDGDLFKASMTFPTPESRRHAES